MSAPDNNSTTKLGIEFDYKPDGSRWVKVLLLKYGPPFPQFWPSLRDLHRMIQMISICEDEKYPTPLKGRIRFLEFLRDAVREPDFAVLQAKYKIPERDGDRVVNAYGAALKPGASTPLKSPEVAAPQPTNSGEMVRVDEIPW